MEDLTKQQRDILQQVCSRRESVTVYIQEAVQRHECHLPACIGLGRPTHVLFMPAYLACCTNATSRLAGIRMNKVFNSK